MSNIDAICQNIETARISVSEYHIVNIVAVSKYVDQKAIENLYNQGQRAFGESRVQDMDTKVEGLEHLPIEWHFIGKLQSNKINSFLKLNPFLLQSLDSISLADALDKRLKRDDKKLSALLQINSSNEERKSGIKLEEAFDRYQEIQESFSNINLQGVMCIGAMSEDNKKIQKSFEDSYKVYEKLQKNGASICSMGMSKDYELAIKCGSNMVRIGKAFFK